MRAVFDTNVVISALVFGRRLAWLRRAWASGAVVPVVCRETAAELLRVPSYPKFRLDAMEREILLADYLPFAEVATAQTVFTTTLTRVGRGRGLAEVGEKHLDPSAQDQQITADNCQAASGT